MKKFTNLPYSQRDLAPSDFYFFGKLKEKFEGTRFENDEELEDAIKEEFSKIQKEELKSVFEEWIDRQQRCISNGGEYI